MKLWNFATGSSDASRSRKATLQSAELQKRAVHPNSLEEAIVTQKVFDLGAQASFDFNLPCQLRCQESTWDTVLTRVRGRFIQLSCPVWVLPGIRMQLVFNGQEITVEGKYYKKKEDGSYEVGMILRPLLSRREPRVATNQPAFLLLPKQAPTPVCIVDVSNSGLGLTSSLAFVPGTFVGIQVDDGVILGDVRYCRSEGNCYRLGIYRVVSLPRDYSLRTGDQRTATPDTTNFS